MNWSWSQEILSTSTMQKLKTLQMAGTRDPLGKYMCWVSSCQSFLKVALPFILTGGLTINRDVTVHKPILIQANSDPSQFLDQCKSSEKMVPCIGARGLCWSGTIFQMLGLQKVSAHFSQFRVRFVSSLIKVILGQISPISVPYFYRKWPQNPDSIYLNGEFCHTTNYEDHLVLL